MAITINGSGTITGYEPVPNGSITSAKLASGVGGKILQVKQAVQSDNSTETTTSNVWEDISGLSVSITPASSSNKILVSYKVCFTGKESAYMTVCRIVRDSTAIGIGDQSGSNRHRATTYESSGAWTYFVGQHNNMFLDSPNTTSATTYKLQFMSSSGETLYVNRSIHFPDTEHFGTQISSITVMEVAA